MVSVQSTVDTGHEDMVHDAQMDYYGTRLATCSSDKTVKIFEVKEGGTQTHVADLRGHEGPVWQVAWAHPRFGSILATCSYDRKVILWREDRTNTGSMWNKIYELANHDSSVNSVCWAPHEYGLVLSAGASDGAISILKLNEATNQWETDKIPNAHTVGCNAVSWAPFSSSGIRRFASGGCDNICKVWRYDDAESRWLEESRLEGHSDWVRDVAWAPSIGGPRSGRSIIASCSQDRRVIMWTSDGEHSVQWTPKELHSFEDVVWHVSWSVSGNMLAVSGGDNTVSLWKENLEGSWVCISDVQKGQGLLTTGTRPSSSPAQQQPTASVQG